MYLKNRFTTQLSGVDPSSKDETTQLAGSVALGENGKLIRSSQRIFLKDGDTQVAQMI